MVCIHKYKLPYAIGIVEILLGNVGAASKFWSRAEWQTGYTVALATFKFQKHTAFLCGV